MSRVLKLASGVDVIKKSFGNDLHFKDSFGTKGVDWPRGGTECRGVCVCWRHPYQQWGVTSILVLA